MNVRFARVSPLTAALAAGFLVVTAPTLGQSINEDLELLPDDGGGAAQFGFSIAIDNGVVAVGAVADVDNGPQSGSAYLLDASTGVQLAKLLPSDGARLDWFGYSISIGNGVVAVGAPQDDDNGEDSGSAYLFDPSTGLQFAKLLPDDGASEDSFGWSLAIANGVVGVGAMNDDDNGTNSGSVYLFNAFTGAQIAKLLPGDGAEFDQFGHSIAIDQAVIAVGATGSAYLFDAFTGAQIAKLVPGDGNGRHSVFGWSLAIDNGVVAVGASRDNDNGASSGSAYLFDASTGEQIAKLLPSDGAEFDQFGWSIAIDNGVVAVGAHAYVRNGTESGSAYLFDASTGAQIAKLLSSDGAEGDIFGYSITFDNSVVAVGAPLTDVFGFDSGSAYVFFVDAGECVRDPEWLCDGDVDGDGQVNPVDAGLVQVHFGSRQFDAICKYDLDCDGQINPVDAGIVQSLFGTCEAPRAVCP